MIYIYIYKYYNLIIQLIICKLIEFINICYIYHFFQDEQTEEKPKCSLILISSMIFETPA